MRLLQLPLKDNPYSIHIGSGLLNDSSLLKSYCDGDNVLFVTNETIAPIYLDRVKNSVAGKNIHQVIIADGEVYKSRESFFKIIDYLVEHGFRRNDTLIALGGGVIGDLSGFAAASYQRGMNLVQIPTSLLSQVDSSVGGKTAINHQQGKNLVGAFYQPSAVIIDVDTLDTLPDREYFSGFGEIIKYALLGEASIKRLLSSQIDKLFERDRKTLIELIYLSCQMKSEIVAKDEKEKGERALLNLGHTFAHALETLTEYKHYLHGEAVAIGIMMALSLSKIKNLIDSQKVEEYQQLLEKLKLPVNIQRKLSVDAFLAVMTKDKKNQSKALRLVLVKQDRCILKEEPNTQLVADVIQEFTA
ncbi:MAG: 3-dehydroquinate synthase [Kangiellaceae bacterium]|nr:3-dehydroquinate synthase [Kangiellaceae bacterium]